MPMLRTKPIETSSSIERQVVSSEILVSISNTPSASKALAVVPTPTCVHGLKTENIGSKIVWEYSTLHYYGRKFYAQRK